MEEKILRTLERPWRFLPHTLAEKLSGGKWKPYEYLKTISHLVVEGAAKGNGRLIVCLPPRHGKSELLSHWVPVWFFENWPAGNVILTSYEADFAATWGRKVRDTIQAHKDKITVRISEESSSASRWNTLQGGGMVTAGAGGPITGRGGDLIIVDDPIKNWIEAQSETVRKNLLDWFFSTLYTRADPGATIIIIQTRWHILDLAGELIARQPKDWQEIRFPALAELNDPLGREPGEALCPERYSEEELKKSKETIGTMMFSALYQQNPAPPQGTIFHRGWWNFYEEKPEFKAILQSWDCGYEAKEDSSYSVCQTWGVADNGFYLVHQFRDRLEYPDLQRTVRMLAEEYSPDLILIEYQASGRSVVQDLYRTTRLPIKAVKTTKESKLLRAELITPLVETGKVFLPQKAKWIGDFLYEMTVFPAGAHSDQVDALSQALIFLKNRFDGERRRRRFRRNRSESEGTTMAGSDGRARRRRRLRLYGGPRIDLFCRWIDRRILPE
jgi:predicted phage terminase large subunit-like protein